MSVTYLGQGIGNSIIQAKIIVRYELSPCGANLCRNLYLIGPLFLYKWLFLVVCGVSFTIERLPTGMRYAIGFFRRRSAFLGLFGSVANAYWPSTTVSVATRECRSPVGMSTFNRILVNKSVNYYAFQHIFYC